MRVSAWLILAGLGVASLTGCLERPEEKVARETESYAVYVEAIDLACAYAYAYTALGENALKLAFSSAYMLVEPSSAPEGWRLIRAYYDAAKINREAPPCEFEDATPIRVKADPETWAIGYRVQVTAPVRLSVSVCRRALPRYGAYNLMTPEWCEHPGPPTR